MFQSDSSHENTAAASTVPPSAGTPLARLSRRRTLRWLVPVGAAGVVALLASGALSANANANLPSRSAAQLLAAVGNAKVSGFSGTVVEKASLGLPELPDLGGATSTSATGLLGLLSGTHTARVWYAGENKQRIALLDQLGEQDVFRNGRELWQWNSDTRTATHTTLAAGADVRIPQQLPTLTPNQAAQQALSFIDPSTNVSTDRAAIVAGRPAYVLVLTPKDTRSRVGAVRISVDGKTMVPLGVQVYARGSQKAAFDVSFTRFSDAVPTDDEFNWKPPAGVTVRQGDTDVKSPATQPGQSRRLPQTPSLGGAVGSQNMTTIGTGWTTVVKLTGLPALGSAKGSGGGSIASVLGGLPEVKGSWGTGRLFQSGLITALITSDGRAYVGAVDPQLLYQAAAK